MKLKLEYVPIPTGKVRASRGGFAYEVLDALREGRAVRFTIPTGKTTSCVRQTLINAAKKRGIAISTSALKGGDTVTVWRRQEVSEKAA